MFEIIYNVAKYLTFLNEGTFVRIAPVQLVGFLLKWNNSNNLDKGLPYVRNLLLLTIKFYFQNQPPKCRVDGYRFRSVYVLCVKSQAQSLQSFFLYKVDLFRK